MNIHELYQLFLSAPGVQTDTRELKEGEIFFALKGPNFDGNQLASQALAGGASFAVIDDPFFAHLEKTILVPDVLLHIQELAGYHRQQFNIPFIAITGSNGKTTTKELVHAVLSTQYRTYTTKGNLNNHIGIPLTLLRIKKDAELAVVEMGANHLQEIASYCHYTMPTHGIITNCGKAHLEGFGSEEGVKKGKAELYDYLREHNGTAIVMWDYDYLRQMSAGIPHRIRYGSKDADIEGSILRSEPYLSVCISKGSDIPELHTRLAGDYNLPNILAAVAAGTHFNVPPGKIKKAIESYEPSNSRSQLINIGSNSFLLDAYNANPSSMQLAIDNFAKRPCKNKVLMLGAMAELGETSMAEHQAIIDLLPKYQWYKVVLVGGDFEKCRHPYLFFQDAGLARDWYRSQQFEQCNFLIKGSRSMKMETIMEPKK